MEAVCEVKSGSRTIIMNYGQWAGLVGRRVTALAGSHDPATLCFLNTGMGSIMTKLAREP